MYEADLGGSPIQFREASGPRLSNADIRAIHDFVDRYSNWTREERPQIFEPRPRVLFTLHSGVDGISFHPDDGTSMTGPGRSGFLEWSDAMLDAGCDVREAGVPGE
jgi:hypothetical protein